MITALEDGRRRIDSGAPFLPLLVITAKAQGNEGRAEKFTRECAEEDRRNPSAMMSAITFRGSVAPSGIQADCVRRLGREPQAEGLRDKTMQVLKKPVDAGKNLRQKLRDRFRRKDDDARGSSGPQS